MAAYDPGAWGDLFVATAGAAAALAGLVFVAVSINITRILELRGVPERGLQTVVLLLGAVVVSVLGLVPQQPATYGVELTVVGAVLLAFLAATIRFSLAGTRGHPFWRAARFLGLLPGSGAYFVGGTTLLAGSGGGLAWVAGGIVGALVGAVVNAWVLLVEILR